MYGLDDLKAQWQNTFKNTDDAVYKIHNRIRKMTNQFDVAGPEMAKVEEIVISHAEYDIPAKLFVPHGAEQYGPCHIYLHGGGFVTCSVESHEGLIRRMALASGHKILAPDYRLAPRHPYPAGPDDAERTLVWAMSKGEPYGIDPSKITLGGDSAGGNMTAYLAQKYRRDLRGQLLLYPLMQMAEKRPQNPGWQDSFMLGVAALSYIDKVYVKGADVLDPRVSPLFEDNLKGLPRAYVLTCELDPLRDEGRAYADKLASCGVEVERRHEKAMPHGFLNFSKAFPPGRTVPLEAGEFLRSCF